MADISLSQLFSRITFLLSEVFCGLNAVVVDDDAKDFGVALQTEGTAA